MTASTAQRLLAQHALEDDPSVLNLTYALAAEGALDAEAFGWALARLFEAYPALGAPLADGAERMTYVDMSEHAPRERARLICALIAREQATPFDLHAPPLVRAVVARLSARRHVLLLTFHHAIADSWALSAYAAFISKAYAAIATGAPLPVPAPQGVPARRPIERRLAAERAALASSLAGLSRAQCDPFPAVRPGALLRWSVALQEADAAVLQAAAVAQRVTRFALLSAVVADAVCAFSGLQALLLGTTVLNRHSGADLAAGEARYQGAIFKAQRDYARSLRQTASAAAAATERMMSYEEQLACASSATGESGGIAPAVFVMLDQHPMAALKLPGVDIQVIVPDGELSRVPRRAHSPRCGRITFFWRDSPTGATLNLFAEEGLAREAEQLLDAVRANLVERTKIGGFVPIPTVPWDEGLACVPIPAVDALSPVNFGMPAHAQEKVA
jgi:hypothetical protein